VDTVLAQSFTAGPSCGRVEFGRSTEGPSANSPDNFLLSACGGRLVQRAGDCGRAGSVLRQV